MMNQQQEARRAATQAFMESLEQLQQTLEFTSDSPIASPTASKDATQPLEHCPASAIDLAAFDMNVWAEAIADIEQFIQEKTDLGGSE